MGAQLKRFQDIVLANDLSIFCKPQTHRNEFKDISKISTFPNSEKMTLQPRADHAIMNFATLKIYYL